VSSTHIERSPSPEETAAIAATIERFVQDTAPVASAGGNELDPWTRSALLEGVSREDHAGVPHPWINT
jgi:hypothetical protein